MTPTMTIPYGDLNHYTYDQFGARTYESLLPGQPLLPNVFGANSRVMVEFAFGADLTADPNSWDFTDVSTDVRQANGGKVTISPMGRANETSQAQPAGCTFQLDNTTAAYSKGPRSKWWPNIRQGTPCRVTVNPGDGSTGNIVRFQGEVQGWQPSWDITGKLAVVTVSASGILRRLNRPKTPKLRSALYRRITGLAPYAYWACEEGALSPFCVNSVPANGTNLVPAAVPIEFSPAASAPINFAGVDGPGGSDKLPAYQVGSYMTATLTASGATSWRMDCVVKTAPVTTGQVVTICQLGSSTGTIKVWEFDAIDTGGFRVAILDINNVSSHQDYNLSIGDGAWHHLSIRATQNGAGIDVQVIGDGQVHTQTITPATIGSITQVFTGLSGSNPAITSAGHFAIWQPSISSDVLTAATGYRGESAVDRLIRLCLEEGVPLSVAGTSTTTMGPQLVDSLVANLRDCEKADFGLLYDGRGPGLGYVARAARYSAATSLSLDVPSGDVDDPFTPADDDQRTLNYFEMSRKNGGKAVFEAADGPQGTAAVGQVPGSDTINIDSDTPLYNQAAWRVRLGTVDTPYRYPSLNLDLAGSPSKAGAWLTTPLAGRIDVSNVDTSATQHPPGVLSLLLEGYGEDIAPYLWKVAGNCSPFEPWNVGALGVNFRLDTGGSKLASVASIGATTLSVTVTGQILWTTTATYPTDFPFWINAGDWPLLVTGITGTSSPQTFTLSGLTPVPALLAAGIAVKLWRPAGLAL